MSTQNTTYTADQFIGSQLTTKIAVNAYASVDANGNGVSKIGVIPANTVAGTIYSWVTINGVVWWLIENSYYPQYQYIYLRQETGSFYQPTAWTNPAATPIVPSTLDEIKSMAKYALWAVLGVSIIKVALVTEIKQVNRRKAHQERYTRRKETVHAVQQAIAKPKEAIKKKVQAISLKS